MEASGVLVTGTGEALLVAGLLLAGPGGGGARAAAAAGLAFVVAVWAGSLQRSPEAVTLPAVLVPAAWGMHRAYRERRRRRQAQRERRLLVTFLEALALYRGAGLGFWPAMEGAARAVPELENELRRLAGSVLAGRPPAAARAEWQELGEWLTRGHRDGLPAGEILRLREEWERREEGERALARGNDPLWLSAAPAVLLLNVVLLFGVPLVVLAGRGLGQLP